MSVPDDLPICTDCGELYGDAVRAEFPIWIGVCAVCGRPGSICRARNYGGLPRLSDAERQRVLQRLSEHGYPKIDDYRLRETS